MVGEAWVLIFSLVGFLLFLGMLFFPVTIPSVAFSIYRYFYYAFLVFFFFLLVFLGPSLDSLSMLSMATLFSPVEQSPNGVLFGENCRRDDPSLNELELGMVTLICFLLQFALSFAGSDEICSWFLPVVGDSVVVPGLVVLLLQRCFVTLIYCRRLFSFFIALVCLFVPYDAY